MTSRDQCTVVAAALTALLMLGQVLLELINMTL